MLAQYLGAERGPEGLSRKSLPVSRTDAMLG